MGTFKTEDLFLKRLLEKWRKRQVKLFSSKWRGGNLHDVLREFFEKRGFEVREQKVFGDKILFCEEINSGFGYGVCVGVSAEGKFIFLAKGIFSGIVGYKDFSLEKILSKNFPLEEQWLEPSPCFVKLQEIWENYKTGKILLVRHPSCEEIAIVALFHHHLEKILSIYGDFFLIVEQCLKFKINKKDFYNESYFVFERMPIR